MGVGAGAVITAELLMIVVDTVEVGGENVAVW